MNSPKTRRSLQNERITYCLETLALSAINDSDKLFHDLTELSIREVRVLRIVGDNGGITSKEIVMFTKLHPTTISKIIQKLLVKKLIQRENSKNDARIFHLFITNSGLTKRRETKVVSDKLDEVLLSPLTETEVNSLFLMLNRISNWITDPTYANEKNIAVSDLATIQPHMKCP